MLFMDKVHRLPRLWSNAELRKFAHLFTGDVANVSGWTDVDKEGTHYKSYFSKARSYTITNYKAEARGFQGTEGEIFLDLEQSLPAELSARFEVVFNHTTLEHIYHAHRAFDNLCKMSRDVVILILPFLQQYRGEYGDYWRFTPLAIKRMFEDAGYELLYQSFNNQKQAAVYTFTIASQQPDKWRGRFGDWQFNAVDSAMGRHHEPFIGGRALPNRRYRFLRSLDRLFVRLPKKTVKKLLYRLNLRERP
jgi:hypothetical protein